MPNPEHSYDNHVTVMNERVRTTAGEMTTLKNRIVQENLPQNSNDLSLLRMIISPYHQCSDSGVYVLHRFRNLSNGRNNE